MNKEPQLSQEQRIMLMGALKNAKDIKCVCGGEIFTEGSKFKLLSRLLIGSDTDQVAPIPTIYCVKCFKEISLEEVKEKDGNEIVLDFKK